MASLNIPDAVPNDLRHLAGRLSWEDAATLLCVVEGWALDKHITAANRAKTYVIADRFRTLVQTLPYDWEPPLVETHDLTTALAAYARTGTMPLAPPGYALD